MTKNGSEKFVPGQMLETQKLQGILIQAAPLSNERNDNCH